MGQIRTVADVKQLGTILSVWAHPDDETFSAAGIMTAAVQNKQRVVCVTATKGEAGSQDLRKWPLQTLARTRSAELQAALEIIGVTEHHWLGYQDGKCAAVDPKQASQQLSSIIRSVEPDSILTFGPDGLTGHPDHQAISAWVDGAIQGLSSRPTVYHVVVDRQKYEVYLKSADAKLDIFFNIDEPPLCDGEDCAICFCCTDELCRKKCDALAAMPSQMERLMVAFGPDFLHKSFEKEVFVKADKPRGGKHAE